MTTWEAVRSLQETCAQVHEISNYVSTASEQLSQKQELISDLADGILSRDVDTLNGQASDVYHAQIAETHIGPFILAFTSVLTLLDR